MFKAAKTVLAALMILFTLVPHASATESPSPRHGARMIYDPVNQRVLLFGGAMYENRYTFYSDMWAFDTASETWTRVEAPAGPEGRFNHNMVYDPDRHQIILFGGLGSDMQATGLKGDTWVLRMEGSWSLVGAEPTEQPPMEQPPAGIPGYPLAAVTLSLALTARALKMRADK